MSSSAEPHDLTGSTAPVSGAGPGDSPGVRSGDGALVLAILRGDRRAASEFYDRLGPVIRHTLRRVLRGPWCDFEDLVQLTFEQVLRGLAADRFRGHSTLSTWAAGIAVHVALDALRRKLRSEGRLSFLHASEPAAAEPRLEARAELQRLHEILARMKPALAEVIVLHDVLGHDLGEVAEQMRLTQSAAQSRLFRARKELLRRSAAKGIGGGPS